MITDAQKNARRKNARLSRGPKTEAGKAASAMNAVKFGFCSRDPTLPGENTEKFTAFRERMLAALAPVGENETALVERVIDGSWRLKRLPAVEADLLTSALCLGEARRARKEARDLVRKPFPYNVDQAKKPGPVRDALKREAQARAEANRPEYALGRAFLFDARGPNSLSLLSRYEAAIERALYRSLRELRMAQEMRPHTNGTSNESVIPIQPQKEKLRNDLTNEVTNVDRAA